MPAAGAQRYSPPNQPTEWNEANPLAAGLVSLLYFAHGQWHESGPFGGQVQCTRIGTTGVDYRKRDQSTGPADAITYGTNGATGGDGYRFVYNGPIASTTDPLTIFSLDYTTVSSIIEKGAASYISTGAGSVIARTAWGTTGGQIERGVLFQHAGSVVSTARTGVTYTIDTPGFLSASKSPQTAVAPLAYASGVLAGTTTNQNAAWIAAIQEIYVGRNLGGSAANQLNGGVAVFGLFNRMLTDAEHLELYRDPWQLLKPTRSAKVFDFAAAAAAGASRRVYYDMIGQSRV